jgi:hypothetical protein
MILVVVGTTGLTHLGKGKGILANDVQKSSGKILFKKVLAKRCSILFRQNGVRKCSGGTGFKFIQTKRGS